MVARRLHVGRGAAISYVLNAAHGVYSLSGESAALSHGTGATFDYYVSTTGSDSNPGTLGSPWAITSLRVGSANFSKFNGVGKRIGLLPGTYDISGLEPASDPGRATGALQMPGGTSGTPNYLGSSDSSGHYSQGAATIDCKGASGLFNGGNSNGVAQYSSPAIAHTTGYTTGNLEIQGIKFTGFNSGIRLGDGSTPAMSNVLVHDCEFYGGGWSTTNAFSDNAFAIWVQNSAATNGITISNNWFHDTIGPGGATSGDHLNAIIVNAQNASFSCKGVTIQFNTCVKAGNIYGKAGNQEGALVQNNYVDCSAYTTNSLGLQDFMATSGNTGLALTSVFRNNVILLHGNTIGGNAALGQPTNSNTDHWETGVQAYNNTIVCEAGSSGPNVAWLMNSTSGSAWYNNIYVNNGSGGSFNNKGNFLVNPAAIALWDYNLVPSSGVSWTLYQNGAYFTQLASYTSAATFNSGVSANGGISGCEAHSLAGAPTFTGTGSYAGLYKLAPGSLGIGSGSTDGTIGGSACDMGAWGGASAPTQIGCDFSI